MADHHPTQRFTWLGTLKQHPRRFLLGAILPAIAVLVVARSLPQTHQASMVIQVNPQWVAIDAMPPQQVAAQLTAAITRLPKIKLRPSHDQPDQFKLICNDSSASTPAKILWQTVAQQQQHLRNLLTETLDQKQAALIGQANLAGQQSDQARQAMLDQQIRYPHLLTNALRAEAAPDSPVYSHLIAKRSRLTEQQATLAGQLQALKKWVASQPSQIHRQLDRPNPLVTQLASRQLQLEEKIDRLQNSGAHATDSHPQVIRLNKRIAKLQLQIAALNPRVPYEQEQTQNIEKLKAQKEVQLMGGQLKAVVQQLAQTQDRLSTFATDNQLQLNQLMTYQRLRGKADVLASKLQALEKQKQVLDQQISLATDPAIEPLIILEKPLAHAALVFPSFGFVAISVILLPIGVLLLMLLRLGQATPEPEAQQAKRAKQIGPLRILGSVDRFQTSGQGVGQRLTDWLIGPALCILFLALLLPLSKAHWENSVSTTATTQQTPLAPMTRQSPTPHTAH